MALPLLAAACSPVYKTEYRFQPPPTQQGQQCANHCLTTLHSCVSQCEAAKKQCRFEEDLKSEAEFLQYQLLNKDDPNASKKTKKNFTNYSHCNTGCKSRCESSQRICHVNCGGNITESRICTAFCD